jgi:alpha-1,4-glucan:alpha-1,4-glucan 6-glycosyltransferase
VAGLLRIDHILGFERLFWVPEGMSPAEGVYVRSPREELMAVVAIEAQRHRADIVGEDLGTVDPVVREAMDRDGVRRSFAGQLSFVPGPEVLAEPPRGSVASFSTHDLPTFLGWWEGRDIVEREELGQVDAATARLMAAERDEERRRLVALLPFEDQGVARLTEPPAGMVAHLTGLLAKSGAGLVMVQVSDLLLERDAVNLPGTSIERPNWLQRWALSLEEIEADPGLRSSLAALQSQFEEAGPQPGRGGREVSVVYGVTRLSEVDDHLFNEGRHFRLYDKLGAHLMLHEGVEGCYFAVWAPNASGVEVAGDFNGWDSGRHPLERHGTTGIWEGFIPGAVAGQRYMYRLTSGVTGEWLEKADPLARQCELPPRTASIISSLDHVWRDERWMEARAELQSRAAPISIYELHLESFRRVPEEGDRPLSYRELAPHLISHVQSLGFTHVELMPVMEYPFSGSWGYQVTGYFAPSSRFGTEEDFAWLIDELHQAGIGVILDWVPAHFPADAFALARFDGTHLYEHADVRQGFHPDWNSLIFNFGRHEVRNFLISSACCWLDRFHVDGLRFDAVASMLYLDYSRAPGEWIPNRYGGRENLDAVELLRSANLELHRSFPGALSIAEESTAWPGVTRPVEEGGLGFDYKWDLGWMHDTLDYLERDPIHRHWHHDQLTFRSLYVKSEHFVLPLSHDEVVHGKGSLLAKMPGDRWQQLANLRLLFGFQLSQPGKKLLFMGDEFAQPGEWDHRRSLDWHLLEHAEHLAMARYVAELGALYRSRPPLHRDDLPDGGFRWIDGNDRAQSVLCIERHDGGDGHLVIVLNATPTPRHGYRVGMPLPGRWELVLDSDEPRFGGSGTGAPAVLEADGEPWHDRPQSALLSLPPLGLVIYGSSNGGIAGAN